jgi:hypothetical protein
MPHRATGVRRAAPGTYEDMTTSPNDPDQDPVMTERSEPDKLHGDPLDPAADREVSAGDVAEDPNAPDEDGDS